MSKGIARRRRIQLILIHIIHAVQLVLVVKSARHIEIVMIIVLVLILVVVVVVVISTLTSILIKFVVVLVVLVLVVCLMPAATMQHWRRSNHTRLACGRLAVGAAARRRENEGRVNLRGEPTMVGCRDDK